MQQVFLWALSALLISGCNSRKADNAATRYAESLQQDTAKAKEVAEKANQTIAASQAEQAKAAENDQ